MNLSSSSGVRTQLGYPLASCLSLRNVFKYSTKVLPRQYEKTYLVVREETECLCCFFSCVRTPWSACVQTVVLTGTGFGKINSESLQIHYIRSSLGICLTVQHPGIDHNYVNQVIENSKLQFFGSHLSDKTPCIVVEQVNILDVAAIHRHNCWS